MSTGRTRRPGPERVEPEQGGVLGGAGRRRHAVAERVRAVGAVGPVTPRAAGGATRHARHLAQLVLDAVKERGRKVRVEKLGPPLEEVRIFWGHGPHGGHGQVEGHAPAAAGRPVVPHVGTHVHLQVALSGERFLTDRAPERLVSGVRSHMNLQGGRG